MTASKVLGWAMRPVAAPGTNLKGEASGAGWLYALPRLDFRHAAVLGLPKSATLAGLVVAADSLLIVVADSAAAVAAQAVVKSAGWDNVEVVAADVPFDIPVGLDLVCRISRAKGKWAREAWTMLMGHLADDGITFHLHSRWQRRQRAPSGRAGTVFRVTPRHGEVRSITLARDHASQRVVRQMGLEGVASGHRVISRLEKRLSSWLGATARHVVVEAPATDGVGDGVPTYLRDVAQDSGLDIAAWRWAVAARGDYDSQKILVLLTAPEHNSPGCLVKITRSARHSDRLDNESMVLRTLTSSMVLRGRVPEQMFFGTHRGRAVLGQSMLAGKPFPRGARWSASCPLLQDSFNALNELADTTAAWVPAASVSSALGVLLERFVAVYQPPGTEVAALRDSLSGGWSVGDDVPVVLQHGDPHPGNMLVSAEGRALLVDWESADLRGMPLWDILYFFRHYATIAARRRGTLDRERAATRHFLDDSDLADRLVAAVGDQVQALGLRREMVKALVYSCWMHRALKESSRLTVDRLDQGLSVRLLRAMIADKESTTLSRLMTLGA